LQNIVAGMVRVMMEAYLTIKWRMVSRNPENPRDSIITYFQRSDNVPSNLLRL
jgi:hypothetical protein